MTTDKPHWNSKAGWHNTYLKRRDRMLKQAAEKYHADPVEGAAKEATKRRRKQVENPSRYMFKHIQSRAKCKGTEFTITEEDIVIPEYCPIMGSKLSFGTNKSHAHSPTLDRKDNTKGYVPGNVWVISHRANLMKGNSNMEELRTFCLACLEHMDSGELSGRRFDKAFKIDRDTSRVLD